MRAPCRLSRLGILALVMVLVPSTALAYKDLVIALDLPATEELGRYSGETRVEMGEVSDEVFAESPEFIGMGAEAAYAILLQESREDSVRRAVSQLLVATGLAAGAEEKASHKVDVVIRRDRASLSRKAMSKYLIRGEVFLEFDFHRDGASVGRVLACGNAERKATALSKTKIAALYQAAFHDALFKLLESETFLRVAGDGWQAGRRPAGDTARAHRITRNRAYGPTDEIQQVLGRAQQVLTSHASRSLVLQEFELKDEAYAERRDADPAFAGRYVPELVREHLGAYYPGAFDRVEIRDLGQEVEGLVVTGDLLRFKIGSFLKQRLIGFGAGKDKLEVEICIKDGTGGEDLFKIHSLSSNWGADWQAKKGQVRDMADQLARDLSFLLVRTLAPGYSHPEDLEVSFDGVEYPS